MSELIENNQQEEREPFVVDTDQKAEWCLRQIREKHEELEKWREHYDALFNSVRKTIESDIVWFEGCLKAFFIQQDSEGFTRETKTQRSYRLPSGKLVLKRQEPEYVRDEETIIEWLRENNPELIKVKESLDWAGLKKTLVPVEVTEDGETQTVAATEDGEIVPGITVAERDPIFKVEVE